jgi:hypothetical protein
MTALDGLIRTARASATSRTSTRRSTHPDAHDRMSTDRGQQVGEQLGSYRILSLLGVGPSTRTRGLQ